MMILGYAKSVFPKIQCKSSLIVFDGPKKRTEHKISRNQSNGNWQAKRHRSGNEHAQFSRFFSFNHYL